VLVFISPLFNVARQLQAYILQVAHNVLPRVSQDLSTHYFRISGIDQLVKEVAGVNVFDMLFMKRCKCIRASAYCNRAPA